MILCLLASLSGLSLSEKKLEGRPWLNAELPGNLPEERPAPEESYYLYVNFDMHQQPPKTDDPIDSLEYRLTDEMKAAVWSMIETGESTEAQVLRILTSLIMDEERREREGMEPLMRYVKQVRETRTLEELSALSREEGFLFGYPYANIYMNRTVQNPEQLVIYIQTMQFIPEKASEEEEESEEAAESEESAESEEAAESEEPAVSDEPVISMEIKDPELDLEKAEADLQRLGYAPEQARQLAELIAQFQLQQLHVDFTAMNSGEDPETAGLKTPSEIQAYCPLLYDQLFSQGWIAEDAADLRLYELDSNLVVLKNMYQEENLDLFQALVCLAMLNYAEDYLDPATYLRKNEITEALDLEAAAYYYIRGEATFLTEQAYMDAYIPREKRDLVRNLTEQYKQALAERLRNASWLSEESRQNAMEKASQLSVCVVGPDEPTDYAPLLKKLSATG